MYVQVHVLHRDCLCKMEGNLCFRVGVGVKCNRGIFSIYLVERFLMFRSDGAVSSKSLHAP